MYRVGFGDFFLLTVLDDDGKPEHIVIDCGVFKGTSQTGDIGSIEAAVANMVETTGGRLALIVMTHRHADHIAGFARCSEAFRGLEVEAVWMPVWESEYEPIATKFQAELTRTALGLRQHFAALGASASREASTALKYMENATGELGATGTGSNAKALDLLKRGFEGVTPRYYKKGDHAEIPPSLSRVGLVARILGPPPVKDLDLMKLMDLQKGIGQYLTRDGVAAGSLLDPFGDGWEVNPGKRPTRDGERERYTPSSFHEWTTERRWFSESVTVEAARDARAAMERALQSSQPVATLTAAKTLNTFLNNQSLVVLFTFKGKNLLFVGDAQAGNWEHWLFETDRPDKKASGTVTPSARQVLSTLDLYKVGHHGSGNATPKVAASEMGSLKHRFVAMCSTEADVYGTEDPDDPAKGTEVPRGPLLENLASESALIRSDQIAISVGGDDIAAAAPAPLPTPPSGSRLVAGPIWVDCFL